MTEVSFVGSKYRHTIGKCHVTYGLVVHHGKVYARFPLNRPLDTDENTSKKKMCGQCARQMEKK